MLAEDSAATEVIFSGTHTGPIPTPNGELPATGRTIQTTSISMLTFADGMVISEHVYSDQLELLTQLGLAASPGPSTGKGHRQAQEARRPGDG